MEFIPIVTGNVIETAYFLNLSMSDEININRLFSLFNPNV